MDTLLPDINLDFIHIKKPQHTGFSMVNQQRWKYPVSTGRSDRFGALLPSGTGSKVLMPLSIVQGKKVDSKIIILKIQPCEYEGIYMKMLIRKVSSVLLSGV